MPNSSFQVSIPNLPKLQAALASYPSIAAPIIQNAIVAAQAILAKFTNGSTVPIKTGYLVQNWAFEIGNLQARWYPKAQYAPHVEFGTAPHVIEAKNAGALYWKGAEHPVRKVHHPGTKANPFLERIIASAQPDIETLFVKALENVTAAIAAQAA